jgi:hypothetical protein
MTFKELHDEVVVSHDNINSIQVQLYKEKAKKKNKARIILSGFRESSTRRRQRRRDLKMHSLL